MLAYSFRELDPRVLIERGEQRSRLLDRDPCQHIGQVGRVRVGLDEVTDVASMLQERVIALQSLWG